MNNGAYAGLRLATRANEPDPINPETPDADPAEPKDEFMTQEEHDAAVAKAKADATAEANTRFSTVLASEEYAGREQLAQTLLGNDKMSADEIVTALAASPRAAVAASDADNEAAAEAGGRAEMQAALSETQNSNIDAGANGGDGQNKADASSLWNQAISANNPGLKLG